MAKPRLGSGKRFAALSQKVGSPALAAWIGRKKYGARKMATLAAKGRRRHMDCPTCGGTGTVNRGSY